MEFSMSALKGYRCGAEGHYAPDCPDVSNITNLQHFILSQSKDVLVLLKTRIIIDMGSTFNSFWYFCSTSVAF